MVRGVELLCTVHPASQSLSATPHSLAPTLRPPLHCRRLQQVADFGLSKPSTMAQAPVTRGMFGTGAGAGRGTSSASCRVATGLDAASPSACMVRVVQLSASKECLLTPRCPALCRRSESHAARAADQRRIVARHRRLLVRSRPVGADVWAARLARPGAPSGHQRRDAGAPHAARPGALAGGAAGAGWGWGGGGGEGQGCGAAATRAALQCMCLPWQCHDPDLSHYACCAHCRPW